MQILNKKCELCCKSIIHKIESFKSDIPIQSYRYFIGRGFPFSLEKRRNDECTEILVEAEEWKYLEESFL